MNELLAQLEAALKRHDWYYDYSDDHRVWSSGNANWKLIQDLRHRLNIEGRGMQQKPSMIATAPTRRPLKCGQRYPHAV